HLAPSLRFEVSSSQTHPRPPSSTIFPYTTLFRSQRRPTVTSFLAERAQPSSRRATCASGMPTKASGSASSRHWRSARRSMPGSRSEEHTSELQSRENLVCRLLLEKKKYQEEKDSYYIRQMLTQSHTDGLYFITNQIK